MVFFFFSSRRRHTRSVSSFPTRRSSDLGIRVNRAKKSGMVNITSSVNSRERSGINTILHELNPLFTINVTMRDIKSKNVYSRVNSKATTQWRKTESANGVHLEGVASDNRSRDRKSGSAGMPRPISYAVFCLKKKITQTKRKRSE